MSPFVHLQINFQWRFSLRHLRYAYHCTAFVQFIDDPVGVKGLVRQQSGEFDTVDERFDTNRIVAISGQQFEANQVPQRISEGQDFGRQATFGFAYSLALSPPFAPCP